MSIYERVARFAQKCGGREKISEGRRGLAGIKSDYQGFVRRVAKTEAGAKQLVASALLGYLLADLILMHGEKESDER